MRYDANILFWGNNFRVKREKVRIIKERHDETNNFERKQSLDNETD